MASNVLSNRERLFVIEYLIDCNAKRAAIDAGYNESSASVTACKLLKNDKIKEAIEQGMEKKQKRADISADYVLDVIVKTIDRCSQAEPVLDKMGNPTGEYKFDAASVLKGADLLGKHLGLFRDKVELTGPDGLPIEVSAVLVPSFKNRT